jgi:RNA polymerase primary sigma factor
MANTEQALNTGQAPTLDQILATLRPKEEKVIRLRFGIGCERAHTLDEIGRKCGVTKERIRQIETVALRKLRHPIRSVHLRELSGHWNVLSPRERLKRLIRTIMGWPTL